MSKSAQAILNYLVGDPRELTIRAHIKLHTPAISMNTLWDQIARREAEEAIDNGWTDAGE